MPGFLLFSWAKTLDGIIGFLKKLPLLPMTFGSGNLDWRISITAFETSCIVDCSMPFAVSTVEIAP